MDPGEEIVDNAVEMAVDDLGEQVGEVGVRVDAAQFAGLDQLGDEGPISSALVGTGEERIFAIESGCVGLSARRCWSRSRRGRHRGIALRNARADSGSINDESGIARWYVKHCRYGSWT